MSKISLSRLISDDTELEYDILAYLNCKELLNYVNCQQ